MRSIRSAGVVGLALGAALAAPAHADIFTWTDASGRTNISNVEPPKDVHARRIVQKDLPKKRSDDGARAAAQATEVQALQDRVAELETEVDDARRRASAAAYRAPVPAAPPVVVVAPPPAAYAPAPSAYAEAPDSVACDPLMFGCPAFGYPAFAYPVNVVVLKNGRRFHRFERPRLDHRVRAVPAHPAFPMRVR
jgi:uncharacterized protein DUF4124